MAYENEPFVKIKDGVVAPLGFHYMPSGRLMSDADHIAMYGYIEKTITGFDYLTNDIDFAGETRSFTIRGDKGAVFSVSVYDVEANTYYNFNKKVFQSTKSSLQKVELKSSSYTFTVKFTKTGVADSTFNINIHAEDAHNIRTIHAPKAEVIFADGTIDNNSSTGSDSKILNKVLTQTPVTTFTLSFIAPSLTATSADAVNGATSSTNRIVIDGDATDPNIVQVGDKVTTTGIAASVHALVTEVNPDGDNVNEIEIGVTDSASNDAAITFTPPFNGMTAGTVSQTVSTGGSAKIPFSVSVTALTGRTFSVTKVPNVNDLCAKLTVTFASAALAILGEDTSTASLFYRWPITNIANLSEGMTLDPSRSGTGVNTITPATISQYLTTITSTEISDSKYSTTINEVTLDDVVVPGVDAYSNDITAIDRNGRITAQVGNITFDVQQPDALKSDSGVIIYAHGPTKIKEMTGMDVSLSNVAVTSTQISTTTTGAVNNSVTIPLTEVGNISTLSTIRGIGIDSEAANPTVANKATTSGAANITASVAQTLESGQTLYFDGASNVVTITGDIEVSNMALSDTTLYFDVERFLRAV